MDTGSQVNLIDLFSLDPNVDIHTHDRLRITGITSDHLDSIGASYIDIFGSRAKFYVFKDSFPLSGNGILGLEFLKREKAEISFHHDSIVLDRDPIKPIPFIYSVPSVGKPVINVSTVSSNSESLSSSREPQPLIVRARSRQVIALDVTNPDITEGYLPLIETTRGVFVGRAAVTVLNGQCFVLAINSTEQDVKLKIPPQELTPYDVFDEESDGLDKIIFAENNKNRKLEERLTEIKSKIGFDKLGPHRKQRVRSYLESFPHLFLLPGDKFPGTTLAKHQIPTVDDVPVFHKQYRYPPVHKEEVRRQISKLIETGVIGPSNSPYNSPLWIVPKKADEKGNKKWRLVIDYRGLNEKTVGDAYPLPNINEILDHLGGAKYFSVFDLASGFHQIPMDSRDKHKTAFSTDNGHYEYNRMPFGLKGAPATFQRLMDRVLVGLQGVELFVYIDDIVVYAATLDEHDQKIFRLFRRLSDAGLRLQPEKCTFLATEVAYLGHTISAEGVRPNPAKIEAVKNFPVPRNPKNIKEFLGLIGYYRRFIPNLANRAKPLTELLRKGRAFVWEARQQTSFEDLRDSLCHEPILQCPDFDLPFILTTDASSTAIGAVLSQGKLGEDLPVCFASRSLSRAEANYTATERECLAVVFFTKHFRHYLYGRKFTIVTDHQALVWLHNSRDPSSRLLRWRLRLLDFQYEVRYRPGRVNSNADALSRNPTDRVTATAVLPIRKRGRPPKLPAVQTPLAETEGVEDSLGIGGRVKLRRMGEGNHYYSYSSDDETDPCNVAARKRTRKSRPRKRMLRFSDASEYLPSNNETTRSGESLPSPNSNLSAPPLSETREPNTPLHDSDAISSRTSKSLPDYSNNLSNTPTPVTFSRERSDPSDVESSDVTPHELEETVIPAGEDLDVTLTNQPTHSTPCKPPVLPPIPSLLKQIRPPEHSSRKPFVLGLYETIPPEKVDRPHLPIPTKELEGKQTKLLTIRTSRDSLTLVKDNLVHFMAVDCGIHTAIGRTLTDLHLVDCEDLKEKNPRRGQVVVSKVGNNFTFSVFAREHSYDPMTHEDLYYSLLSLRVAMEVTKVNSFRISQVGDGLERLSPRTLHDTLKMVFSNSGYTLTICTGEIQVPPPEQRKSIIREYHASLVGGHKGVTKTFRRIRNRFVWPEMKGEIQDFIRTCLSCQKEKLVRIKTRQPMIVTDTPADAFDKVALDILGPLPITPDGNQFVLTMQDNLTKYYIAVPIRNKRASTVADAFARWFIALFGCPRAILTDRGGEFVNKLLKDLAAIFKIRHVTTSGYYPQSNGSLERSHQVLADYLKHYIGDYEDWDRLIPFAMLSYNSSVHEGTQFAPHNLVFGKTIRLPSSFPSASQLETYGSYLDELVTHITDIRAQARNNLIKAKERSKIQYDKKAKIKNFNVGDMVFVLEEPKRGKLGPYYCGPF